MDKILVIGFGSIGKRHFNILKELLPNSAIDVVSKQNLENIKVYKSLSNIENIDVYDYFVISSETYKHYEQLKYVENKVKNKIILVEKPLFEKYKNFKPLMCL